MTPDDIWGAMSVEQLREMHERRERKYERLLGSDLASVALDCDLQSRGR